jgi:hypothetical protein
MKVKIGDSIKNIPKRFHPGVFLMKESQLEAPDKIRLTPFERFLFAEAAWRHGLESMTRSHLDGYRPLYASVQFNRVKEKRYVVYYENKANALCAMAIVPKGVYKKCPSELRKKGYFEW